MSSILITRLFIMSNFLTNNKYICIWIAIADKLIPPITVIN